jgi:NitT/TauT family transport system substrate-binding protein
MGFGDINSLIKFRDANPARRSRRCSWSTTSRRSRSSAQEPRRVGAEGSRRQEARRAAADGAYAQWPIFTQANGIDASKVTIVSVGFPVREPMLASGEVDAITASRSRPTST